MTTPTTRTLTKDDPVGWYQAMLPNGDERFVWWNQAIACDQFGNPHKGRDVEILSGPLLTASEWEAQQPIYEELVKARKENERLREIEQLAKEAVLEGKERGYYASIQLFRDGIKGRAPKGAALIDIVFPAFTPPPKPELRLWKSTTGAVEWAVDRPPHGYNLCDWHEIDSTGKPLEKQA